MPFILQVAGSSTAVQSCKRYGEAEANRMEGWGKNAELANQIVKGRVMVSFQPRPHWMCICLMLFA
jgi:hypothetical protein